MCQGKKKENGFPIITFQLIEKKSNNDVLVISFSVWPNMYVKESRQVALLPATFFKYKEYKHQHVYGGFLGANHKMLSRCNT